VKTCWEGSCINVLGKVAFYIMVQEDEQCAYGSIMSTWALVCIDSLFKGTELILLLDKDVTETSQGTPKKRWSRLC
jgi:hypothetical protein